MSYREKVDAYKEYLQGKSERSILELAATRPGGPMDAPFAPIDPALHSAASEIAKERGLSIGEFRKRIGG